MAIISDLALSYGGSHFYEYHKYFSAKAAMYKHKFNQRQDWSIVELTLISRHFTGHKTLVCTIRGSHTTSLSPRTALQELSTSKFQPKPRNSMLNSVSHPSRRQVPFPSGFKSPICIFISMRTSVHILLVNLCMYVVYLETATHALFQ